MLDSKSPSDSTDYVEYGGHIQRWNPMEADFLASKNNYAYDDEDASIAIQGYSEDNNSNIKYGMLYIYICFSYV